MKKTAAILILATLLLTACTGKKPPTKVDIHANILSSSQTQSDFIDNSSTDQDVSNKNPNVPPSDIEKYTIMPQAVTDFFEENALELNCQRVPDVKDVWQILLPDREGYFEIGAVMDITDKNNPTIIYLLEANLDGTLLERGFTMTGVPVGVVFDDNGKVTEFFNQKDDPAIWFTMAPQAYVALGIAPNLDLSATQLGEKVIAEHEKKQKDKESKVTS